MEWVKLGDVCEFLNGYAFKSSDYISEGYRVIRITNVQRGNIVDNDPKYVNTVSTNIIEQFKLFENDILISLTGNVGRVGMIKNELLPAVLNQRVGCIRIKDKSINNKFLYYFLNRYEFELKCIENSKGIAQKNMSMTFLENVEIPMFDMQTQLKIVEILDNAQSLIDKRKEQIELLDELIQSIFYDMFGDPISNSKGWEKVEFEKVGTFKRGTSKHRPRNAPELLGGKYPLIQTGDISKADLYLNEYTQTYSELGLKQSKMWDKGTFVITIAANIADTAILNFDACFPDSVVAFIPKDEDRLNKIYLHYWFKNSKKVLDDMATKVAQKNINVKILNRVELIIPPIELQNQFAEKVQAIESQKELLNQSLKELENNFNSIMQKAFKGELIK